MAWLGVVAAVALIGIVFIDAFEAMILPRRVRHGYRLARIFYRTGWAGWGAFARLLPAGRWRQGFLSIFGPLSLFALMGIWAMALILGFALLHWSVGTDLSSPQGRVDESFANYLYFSGATFFTLGFGDAVPNGAWGRASAVAEAGLGFGFLAVVISYLPMLHQSFARREIMISLFDARAGSPPSAGELLMRAGQGPQPRQHRPAPGRVRTLGGRGAGKPSLLPGLELLSLAARQPILGRRPDHDPRYGRVSDRQHGRAGKPSGALDVRDGPAHGGRFGHGLRDAAAPPRNRSVADGRPRPAAGIAACGAGRSSRDGPAVEKALAELRGLYEPFVNALALHFQFELPPFLPAKPPVDNWQTSAWMRRSPGFLGLPAGVADDGHFD